MRRTLFIIMTLLLVLLSCLWGWAQSNAIFVADGRITVSPDTKLTVRGGMENNGSVRNDGHIKVSGHWVNGGVYTPGAGRVTFDGSATSVPQFIHHHGQKFHAVTLQGGARKVVVSDMFVEEALHFSSGILEPSGPSRVVLGPEVRLTGASDSSHVYGKVYHRGRGAKLFPLGNGTHYLPVELPVVRDTASLIGIQVFEPENFSAAVASGLEAVAIPRYWYVDIVSGALPPSPVVLPARGPMPAGQDGVVVAQASALSAPFASLGGEVASTGRALTRVRSTSNITMPFVTLATPRVDHGLTVYNAVSDNGDGRNDFVIIENIERYPGNVFSVFNRWGDKVFEVTNYDNAHRVFQGRANLRGDSPLASGTYFYVLILPGQEPLRGYITVRN